MMETWMTKWTAEPAGRASLAKSRRRRRRLWFLVLMPLLDLAEVRKQWALAPAVGARAPAMVGGTCLC